MSRITKRVLHINDLKHEHELAISSLDKNNLEKFDERTKN